MNAIDSFLFPGIFTAGGAGSLSPSYFLFTSFTWEEDEEEEEGKNWVSFPIASSSFLS
jgi:hypothetical protein